MLRTYRFVFRPGWLVLHAVCVVAIYAMIRLGRWQLSVSEHKHFSVQNFGYAIQWWLFAVFVVVLWVRALRDRARGNIGPDRVDAEYEAMTPVAYRRYVPPAIPAVSEDPTVTAYNDYLARLAARDARERSA